MQVGRTENPEVLIPLLEQWIERSAVKEYGFSATLDGVMNDIKAWMEQYPGVIFVARHKGEIVGFMTVFALSNFLAKKLVAIEKYWYGQGGLELFKEAQKWAKENDCGHFIASASKLAGDRHDRVKKLCENIGMKLFETAYITEVN